MTVTVLFTGAWVFSNATIPPPSKTGQLRGNNASASLMTALYLSDTTDNNTDVAPALRTVQVDDEIRVQVRSDSTMFTQHRVSAAPIDHTTWFEYPVSYLTAAGSAPNPNTSLAVSFLRPEVTPTPTPPVDTTASYATLAEFKAAITIADTVDDADLQRALDSATAWINRYCGRTFYAVDYTAPGTKFFLPYDTNRLEVPDLASVAALEIDTAHDESFKTALDADDYDLHPLNLMPGTGGYTEIRVKPLAPSWFIPGYQVRVTAFWGFGSTPAAVTQACILVANRWFTRLSVPFSMFEAPQTGELATLVARDDDVVNLLAPYVTSNGAGRAAAANWLLV